MPRSSTVRPSKSAKKVPATRRRNQLAKVQTTTLALPRLIGSSGPRAGKRFLEFFTAEIRNPHTREAYARAAGDFLNWAELQGLELESLEPLHAAAYVELLGKEFGAATVKLRLSGLRNLFDYLVTGQVVRFNPFAAVRGPRMKTRVGKTKVLFEDDARTLLESIDTSTIVGLRDKAIISIMTYAFARVSAVIGLILGDYDGDKRSPTLALHEKGGQFLEVPVHHKAAEALDRYIQTAELKGTKTPLFQSTRGRSGVLTGRPLTRDAVFRMVKRRVSDAGLSEQVSCHSFRATGITNYLGNGGALEMAAAIAGHASTTTTQLYDRNKRKVAQSEIERIRI